MKRTLRDIIKAVKGIVVMNSELEELFLSLVIGKVPNSWMSKSYPSLKPLGSYTTDLLTRQVVFKVFDWLINFNFRLKFLQDWIDGGPPIVFWLSGFYFTQSFLTGVLQNYSRRLKLPIDWIHFEYFTTTYEHSVPGEPETGVYVKVCNLLLQGLDQLIGG